MKISIIMPTYQDADSIGLAIESVISQTYDNWELIIINDGSTDQTADVVLQYLDRVSKNKIRYFEQKNADQLNAIKNGIQYVTGNYIFILHSDDMLADNGTLAKFVAFEQQHPGYDAYTGDQILIDGEGFEIRRDYVMRYKQRPSRVALLYLWLGRNLYIDVAFFRTDIYCGKIKETYLNQNMPFWLDLSQEKKCLNVINMKFSMFRYRVFEGNYINNEIGKLNVINGELRTLTSLMKYFYIPAYRFQYILFRIVNKFHMASCFFPFYLSREEKNKGQIVKFAVEKRFGNSYHDNVFLNQLVSFYTCYKTNQIWETIQLPKDLPVFLGSDMRAFNNALLSQKLDEFYISFLEMIGKGVHQFRCRAEDIKKLEQICEFFCIRPFVTVHVLAP